MAEFLTDDEIDALLGLADESHDSKKKSEFLDQYEINELMGIDNDEYYKDIDNLDKSLGTHYAMYNFTKPNRLPIYIEKKFKNILKNVEDKIYLRFDTLFDNNSLTTFDVDQISFIDLKDMTLRDESAWIYTFNQDGYIYEYRFNNDSICIETNPTISKQIIKYLTGEGDLKSESSKTPTKLELSVFEVFQDVIVQELQNEFNNILPTNISDGRYLSNFKSINTYEDRTQMLQLVYELRIDKEKGYINIMIPLKSLSSYIDKFKNKGEVNKEFIATESSKYEVVSLMLKNKDIVEGNQFDLSILGDEVFSQIDMPKLDFSSDNEIRNNISLKTKTTFKEAENSEMNFDLVNLEHDIDEDLEVWIDDQQIGYGKFILIGGHNGFKFTNFNRAKEDVINNIKNRFNIIKNDGMLYLTQDNRVLFELEQNQDTKMYSLKRV